MTRFLVDNLLSESTITPSSQNALFPADNLYSNRRAEQFRFTGNTDENIVIFKSGQTFDTAIIDSHNLTSGATVKLQANAADTWTSPSVDITLTVADVISYNFSAVQSYDYVRFTFADSGNSDPIQIGIIFLALSEQAGIRDGFITPWSVIGKTSFRGLDISLPYSVVGALDTFLTSVAGTIQLSVTRQQFGTAPPFYTVIDDEDCVSYPPLFGILSGEIGRTKIDSHGAYGVSIQIQEVN